MSSLLRYFRERRSRFSCDIFVHSAENLGLRANEALYVQCSRGHKSFRTKTCMSDKGFVQWDEQLSFRCTLYSNKKTKAFSSKQFLFHVRSQDRKRASHRNTKGQKVNFICEIDLAQYASIGQGSHTDTFKLKRKHDEGPTEDEDVNQPTLKLTIRCNWVRDIKSVTPSEMSGSTMSSMFSHSSGETPSQIVSDELNEREDSQELTHGPVRVASLPQYEYEPQASPLHLFPPSPAEPPMLNDEKEPSPLLSGSHPALAISLSNHPEPKQTHEHTSFFSSTFARADLQTTSLDNKELSKFSDIADGRAFRPLKSYKSLTSVVSADSMVSQSQSDNNTNNSDNEVDSKSGQMSVDDVISHFPSSVEHDDLPSPTSQQQPASPYSPRSPNRMSLRTVPLSPVSPASRRASQPLKHSGAGLYNYFRPPSSRRATIEAKLPSDRPSPASMSVTVTAPLLNPRRRLLTADSAALKNPSAVHVESHAPSTCPMPTQTQLDILFDEYFKTASVEARHAMPSDRFWNGISVSACMLSRCLRHWDAFHPARSHIAGKLGRTLRGVVRDIHASDSDLSYSIATSVLLISLLQNSNGATPAPPSTVEDVEAFALKTLRALLRNSLQKFGQIDTYSIFGDDEFMINESALNHILSVCQKVLSLLKANHVVPSLRVQFLKRLLQYVVCNMFNSLLQARELCTTNVGFKLQMCCSTVKQWAYDEGGNELSAAAVEVLQRLQEASQLMLVDGETLDSIAHLQELAPSLNYTQLDHLLTAYNQNPLNIDPVPERVLTELKALRTQADPLDVEATRLFLDAYEESSFDLNIKMGDFDVKAVPVPPQLLTYTDFWFLRPEMDQDD